MTKYIFVTGGVVSSLGKGIVASSLGRLLKNRGLKVFMQKFDPYLNVDPGTMSPYQHGEVFVTKDGAETDLDLGHYERFIDEELTKESTVTSGTIYKSVLEKERAGDYQGKTVQVIPHVTNEIKSRLLMAATVSKADVVITEIGGTVGDFESLPFLEAIRQWRRDVGVENTFYIENFLLRVNQIYNKKKRVLVAVSEGITDKDGEYILKHRLFNNEDNFGHLQLGGVGQVLAQIVNTRLDLPIRSVELNLPQRCASHIASLTDLKEAYLCGYNALKMALNGNTGIMVAMKRIDNYHIDYVPVKLVDVANFVKKVPLEYIDTINANIHDSFIEYALPLIQGEPTIRYENGFPKFAKLNKIIIKK